MAEKSPRTHRFTRGLVGISGAILSVSAMKSDVHDFAGECRAALTTDGQPSDQFDRIARELCSSYSYLRPYGFNKYGLGAEVFVDRLGLPTQSLEQLEELISPLQPFSATPNLRLVFQPEKSDKSYDFLPGTVTHNNQPLIGYNIRGIQSPDTGTTLYWVVFHESAHTVGYDSQFRKDMKSIIMIADRQIEHLTMIPSDDPEFSILSGRNECPVEYGETIYSLFDESSYVDDDCLQGHPYTNIGEFMASALTSMHLFSDQFVEKFRTLSRSNQRIASFAIRAVVKGLKRVNSDADITEFIPPRVLALQAKL